MGFLFDSIIVDPKVERFVTNLLLNQNVNRTFAELLLRELMHVQFHKIAFPDTVVLSPSYDPFYDLVL